MPCETGKRCESFDRDVFGSVVFDASGRIVVLMTSGDRMQPESDSEMATLFKSMVAYAGTWSIDDEKLVTRVDGVCDPRWVGTEQVRYHAFDGHTLSLRTALLQHPASRAGRDWLRRLGARAMNCTEDDA